MSVGNRWRVAMSAGAVALLAAAGAGSFARWGPLADAAQPKDPVVIELDEEKLVDLRDPNRAPIEFPVGDWGHVVLPAGWVPGLFVGRSPNGEVWNWTFEHKGEHIMIHFDDATGRVAHTENPSGASDAASADALRITADLDDGE